MSILYMLIEATRGRTCRYLHLVGFLQIIEPVYAIHAHYEDFAVKEHYNIVNTMIYYD